MTKSNSFVEAVQSYIQSEKLSLPIFDPVAMKVQLELIKKNPDVRKLEKMIIADQSLSSNILKVANSSRYGKKTQFCEFQFDLFIYLSLYTPKYICNYE